MSDPAVTIAETPAGETLRRLVIESEIRSVLARYCRAVDRMDWELLASLYHPDAIDNHVSFVGDVASFVNWVREVALPRFVWSMHNLGTCVIEIDGDTAHVETYAVAYHGEHYSEDEELLKTIAVRYVDRFESRAGGPWLIADRVVTAEWRREERIPSQRLTRPDELTGRRDRLDVAYRR
jgi:hypothetical protein